jgi:phosphoglycerol transferase MdoB-like AlkP superfamily enzyme
MKISKLSKKGSLIGGSILLVIITIVIGIILTVFVITSSFIKDIYNVPTGVEQREPLLPSTDLNLFSYVVQSHKSYEGKVIEVDLPDIAINSEVNDNE